MQQGLPLGCRKPRTETRRTCVTVRNLGNSQKSYRDLGCSLLGSWRPRSPDSHLSEQRASSYIWIALSPSLGSYTTLMYVFAYVLQTHRFEAVHVCVRENPRQYGHRIGPHCSFSFFFFLHKNLLKTWVKTHRLTERTWLVIKRSNCPGVEGSDITGITVLFVLLLF